MLNINYATAKQTKFSKKSTEQSVSFHYQWLDQVNKQQALSFSLDKTVLFGRYRNFKAYREKNAKMFVDQQVRKNLMKQPLADVQLSFLNENNSPQIQISGQNQQAVNKAAKEISALEQRLMAKYLTDNYYIEFTSYDNNRAIKPDHVRFARESVIDFKPLKPMILDTVSIQNVRMVTNYILGFVQSIPYSTLESRVTSSGAGFNPPFRTLWENQGDCDSKVTLTAALFRSLMPRIKMMLVFIDNHALLAIDIPSEGDEITINVDGINYVLAEPTGPHKMLMGELSEASEFAIRNGRYYAEPFFAD